MPESTVNSFIDLYDSELLGCERVIEILNQRQAKGGTNLEAFRQECIERFHDMVNLKVDVKVYTTNEDGLFWFEIDIVDRLTEFDPDRQVHEVVNDILELGEGGVIKSPSGLTVVQGGQGHSHSHGGHHH